MLAGGDETHKAAAIAGMRRLNRAASEALIATGGVHAVTDVTGYALAGHGWEMAERSHGAFRIASSWLPLYPGLARSPRAGAHRGDARNRTAVGGHVRLAEGVDPAFDILAFDPQTSGGLLAAVDPKVVDELRDTFTVIGEVVDGEPELFIV